MKQGEGPKGRPMKILRNSMLGMIMLIWLLAPGCATEGKYPQHMNPRPFYNDTWWGSDPVCSPGCPSAPAGQY
jgi:hypothetical protein